MAAPAHHLVDELRAAGVRRGDLVGLAFAPGVGLALAPLPPTAASRRGGSVSLDVGDPAKEVGLVDDAIRPRWVLWSNATAEALVRAGVRIATSWDIAAIHRLLFGGWRADSGQVWAQLRGLGVETVPKAAAPNLFSPLDADPDEPLDGNGHLRPEWVNGGWASSRQRRQRWAELAVEVAVLQQAALAGLAEQPTAEATARSESAAELLCAEMSVDGLPVDRTVMQEIIAASVGPRPNSESEAVEYRKRRDRQVISHLPAGVEVDLRSPGQVRTLLATVGIDVPDTRAARLRSVRDRHPLVEALLVWRKAERVATTYGYAWLDTHVDGDGRLRGEWSGSDGAAGRMTASAGLHNMPADMRSAVIAEPGRVFVRADLGQIEPRVLAAVSRDRNLARATLEDDMYSPVAAQLGVDRATAKVAVLGAMYGQTTGHGAQALRRLKAAYPVAMAYLDDADLAGQVGHDLRTYGGRLITMGSTNVNEMSDQAARSRAAARGRYGRNALVQGAAAELFKVWAVTVRARAAPLSASIVLCLHDELLVDVPEEHGETVARLLDDCLQEAAHRWAPDNLVRFVADISILARWSDAKA